MPSLCIKDKERGDELRSFILEILKNASRVVTSMRFFRVGMGEVKLK